jgi:hypothetical protein
LEFHNPAPATSSEVLGTLSFIQDATTVGQIIDRADGLTGTSRLEFHTTGASALERARISREGAFLLTNGTSGAALAGFGGFRYNTGTNRIEVSENGGGWTDLVGGGAAPVGAQYLVLVADATLTSERVFTPSTGIGFTDGGAGGAYTVTNTLRTGLAGGQTVIGGTAASENLTLSSTSNATKGYVQLDSELRVNTTGFFWRDAIGATQFYDIQFQDDQAATSLSLGVLNTVTSGFATVGVSGDTAFADFIAYGSTAAGSDWGVVLANSLRLASSGGPLLSGTDGAFDHYLVVNDGIAIQMTNVGRSVVLGAAGLLTTATDGFLYLRSMAGTPSGTPTTFTDRVPVTVDRTNNLFYFYSSGAWRSLDPLGNAPTNATYVTVTANATLTDERLLAGEATVVTITDGGVGGNITVSIAALGISTAKIADDAVTFAKIQNITTDRLLGRDTAATGDVEEITVGGGLEFTGALGIQRSALTGDVTASAGSGTTTIAANAVTDSKLRDSAGTSVIGKFDAGTGDPADIVASLDNRVLARSGGTLAFQTIVAAMIGTNVVGNTQLRQSAGTSVIGKASAGTGDVADIVASVDDRVLARASGSLSFQQVNVGMVADAAITFTKIQDISAASRLLGRGSAAGAGDVEEITIGSGLAMTGTVLSSTGSGAPANAQYLVLVADATLTDERVITISTVNGLRATDAGAGGAYTIFNTLIEGLAGSQTIIGGTGASETLTLQSTTNATRGPVLVDASYLRVPAGASATAPGLVGTGFLTTGFVWDSATSLSIAMSAIDTLQIEQTTSKDVTLRAAGTDGFLAIVGRRSAASTGTDIPLESNTTRTDGQIVSIRNSATNIFQVRYDGETRILPQVQTTGNHLAMLVQTPAHTGITASAEHIAVDFDLDATVIHATGAIATQRTVVYRAPTHDFVGPSTITNAATVAITGAPIAVGNALITNSFALWVQSGITRLDGSLQAEAAVYFSGDITPATITADINDYDPTGLSGAMILRLASDTNNRRVTGIEGGTDGRILQVRNVGTTTYILSTQDAASLAKNRFDIGTDVEVAADEDYVLIYDATNTRWRSFAGGLRDVAVTNRRIQSNAITDDKLRDSVGNSVIGRAANTTGDPADIVAGTDGHVLRLSGTTLGFGTVATAGITDAAVTYAKIQDISAASKMLGRGSAAGAGDVEEITLGSGLTMTGTTLSASGGGGAPANATYVVISLDGTLTDERTLAGESTVISITDGGAGGAVTIGIAALGISTGKLADNSVTDTKLRDSVGLSVVGRASNTTGDVADIVAATDGQFLKRTGTAIGFDSVTISRVGTVLNPTVQNIIAWRAPFACTVTAVKGYRVAGTGATVNARRNGADNHLASALSLTSADTWQDGGSVQNTAYAAGDRMEIMVVSVAGTPTQVSIQVDFTRP